MTIGSFILIILQSTFSIRKYGTPNAITSRTASDGRRGGHTRYPYCRSVDTEVLSVVNWRVYQRFAVYLIYTVKYKSSCIIFA